MSDPMAKRNRAPVEELGGELEITAIGKETGEAVDQTELEQAGIAFDATRMHLDLTKAEKRRTTALMLAIQAYDKLIIKDAEYLREAHAQARSDGSVIRPATMDAMVLAALQFDAFISGQLALQQGNPAAEARSDEVPERTDGAPVTADAVREEPR